MFVCSGKDISLKPNESRVVQRLLHDRTGHYQKQKENEVHFNHCKLIQTSEIQHEGIQDVWCCSCLHLYIYTYSQRIQAGNILCVQQHCCFIFKFLMKYMHTPTPTHTHTYKCRILGIIVLKEILETERCNFKIRQKITYFLIYNAPELLFNKWQDWLHCSDIREFNAVTSKGNKFFINNLLFQVSHFFLQYTALKLLHINVLSSLFCRKDF